MAEMKDSGIEWIGKIPKDWEITKINNVYELRNTKVSDRDYEPLSVTMNGIVPQLENAAKTNAHDDRKLVLKGDFAINSRSDRRGSCGISKYNGSVSLINTVLKPKDNMNPDYYNYLFHTTQFSSEYFKWGHGIVSDLWTTNWQDMKNITITKPPYNEQIKISDFLEKQCSEIDALTSDIEKQIELLEDYKKSVITEVVTKGLNPDVEMKDSGIEWIGEIPKDWNVGKIKHYASSISKGNGITKEDIVENGTQDCVRYGEIYTKYENQFFDCITKTELSKIISPKYFSYGDILLVGTGELIEEIGKNIVYLGDKKCLAGGDIVILKHQEYPAFLNYVLNSNYVQNQKSYGKAKLKVVHITGTEIGNLWVAIPSYDEQKKIADYLDTIVDEINQCINQKLKQIDIINNYKKSLIYEYVTGKKEVPSNE